MPAARRPAGRGSIQSMRLSWLRFSHCIISPTIKLPVLSGLSRLVVRGKVDDRRSKLINQAECHTAFCEHSQYDYSKSVTTFARPTFLVTGDCSAAASFHGPKNSVMSCGPYLSIIEITFDQLGSECRDLSALV